MSYDTWFAEAEKCIKRGDYCASQSDWRGAYGSYGTAVEFALKAIYLRNHQIKEMPAHLHTAASHDLSYMATLAGLDQAIQTLPKHLRRNWAVVRDWDQRRRYPNEPFPARDGKDLRKALLDKPNGVWQWLRNI
jgi:hypothetical protein